MDQESAPPSESLPVVNRCGECTACCSVTAIAELDKDAYQDCPHLIETGCGQYSERPHVCRKFQCMFLSDGWGNRSGGEMLRPDRCGLLVYGCSGSGGEPAIRIAEVFPGAMAGEVATQLLSLIHI